ncbi:YceI family protein [Winogradskyella undariae]|uniref:YceI family protein n=1 Tax=Winogradskyella TaxID=286104 RepID=UPI00156BB924|nr:MULTISPECIES: YceI family protein [Winogradskyella]NRR91905.1 YceI family protein [Winogradskyella undariae]QXP78109.1 YceI family protein [Winogradskyella sp. HaHa_3_26]
MKNTKLFSLLFILTLGLTSCKEEKKEAKTEPTETVENAVKYVIKPTGTSVKWTAYKTTDKLPVGGEFATLNFDAKEGATPEEALNNLEFSIPISNLLTKDASRDAKIKASFFGAMLDTEFIKGTIKYVDNAYVASITMNGVTADLPLDVSITDERRVSLKGTMQLKNWDALGALESLNKVCFDLHKGADGVSKTWEDVAIEVNTFLREN